MKSVSIGVALVGAIVLLNLDNPGYLGVTPHPYLVLAVLFGAALGFRAALGFNVILAALYLYFYDASVDREAVEAVFTFRVFILPFVMVLLPIVLGALTDRIRQINRRLRQELASKETMIREIQELNTHLQHEKNQMESRLASQVQTVSRVFEFARAMETESLDEIAETVVGMVCTQLSEDNCYVYFFKNGVLRLANHKDSEEEAKALPTEIALAEVENYPLLKRVIETREVVKPQDLSTPDPAAPLGLAAPMLGLTGSVLGLIVVRRLHFLNCLPSTFSTFHALSAWAGMCLERAIRVQEVRAVTFRDEVTGLHSYSYFRHRIAAEFRRARKYNMPLSMLRFHVPGLARYPADQRLVLQKLLADCLSRSQGDEVDAITIGAEPGVFYALMMLASDAEVEAYRLRVQREFAVLKDQLRSTRIEIRIWKTVLNEVHGEVEDFLEAEMPCDV